MLLLNGYLGSVKAFIYEAENISYQLAAIESVCDLFRGQEICRTEFTVKPDPSDMQMRLHDAKDDLGVGNRLTLLDDELLANLHDIQLRNGVRPSADLSSGNFTVEMEMGTGKTYVYLRYDGSKPGAVRNFATSPQVQIMVVTVGAINKKDVNNLYKDSEKTGELFRRNEISRWALAPVFPCKTRSVEETGANARRLIDRIICSYLLSSSCLGVLCSLPRQTSC